jgi:integrase/5-methylcytosine-specific restriction endonuclease McrA
VPIKSELRHLYGPEWKRISHAAVVRAGFRCQRCGLPNYTHVRRQAEGPPVILDPDQAELAMREGHPVTKVVLTVAHLDQDPANNAPENLAALCQRCHLEHDRGQHIRNARQTRITKKDDGRFLLRLMMGLPPEPPPDPTARKPRKPRYQRGSLSQIERKGRKLWYAQWRQDGGRRTKILGPCSRMSRAEATSALARIVEPLNRAAGLFKPGAHGLTFRDFVEREYLPLKSAVWKRSTESTNEGGIRQHLLPAFGKQLLTAITRRELQDFISDRAPRYSRSVMSRLAVWLKDIFGLALADGVIPFNPAAALQIPRTCKPSRERRPLTIEEAELYLSLLDPRERLIARLCLVEGMRKGEAFALRWRDIEAGCIQIRQRVYSGNLDTPKSGRTRVSGLSEGTRALLEAWRDQAECNGPDDFVFVSASLTTPLRPENVWKKCFKPRLKPHGLEWATFHALRHTNASLMRKVGIDAKVGADQRGHGIGVSLDIYTHSDQAQKSAAVQQLDQAIRERKSTDDDTSTGND